MKRPSDTTILILSFAVPSGVILLAAALYFLTHYHPKQLPQPKKPVATPFIYPSPNKQEADYNSYLALGPVAFEVMQGSTSIDVNGAVYGRSYIVRYTSQRVGTVTVTGNDLNVGCIAKGNKSFQVDNSIFNAGKDQTSLNVLKPRDAVLDTYKSVEVEFNVPGDCQYIGTGDGVWWWKVGE